MAVLGRKGVQVGPTVRLGVRVWVSVAVLVTVLVTVSRLGVGDETTVWVSARVAVAVAGEVRV